MNVRTMLNVIALAGAALVGAGSARADAGHFDKKVAADPHGTVEISNVAGRIEVSGWDDPEVQVSAEISSGVDRIDVTSDKGRTTIKVIVPNHSTFHGGWANLSVRVPRGSDLEVSAVSADVSEANVDGGLALKTVSGDVKADFGSKDTEVKTVSGDVVLRGRGQTSASTHISTVSGAVQVEHFSGDLDATTVSGDMTVRVDLAKAVRTRTTSGDFTLEGKLARSGSIDAESVSGDVIVRAAPEGGLQYEVQSFSGDIRNCMGLNAARMSQYGPGHRLQGTRGGDKGGEGARVRLKTMSGDIELCDKQ